MESTNASLIYRARSGEQAAWAQILDIYSPFLDHWFRKWGATEPLADLRQDVLMRSWRGLANFNSESGGSFRGWLLVIARNVLRDRFQRLEQSERAHGGSAFLKLVATVPDDVIQSEGESAVPESTEIAIVRGALASLRENLTARSWKVFQLTAIDGKTSKEAALELNSTPAAVRKCKARAMSQLRDMLQGIDGHVDCPDSERSDGAQS